MELTLRTEGSNLPVTYSRPPQQRQRTSSFIEACNAPRQQPATPILATNLTHTPIVAPSGQPAQSAGIQNLIVSQMQQLHLVMEQFPNSSQQDIVLQLASTPPFRIVPREHIGAYLNGLGVSVIDTSQQSTLNGPVRSLVLRVTQRFRLWDQERGIRVTLSGSSFQSTVQRKGCFVHITHEIAPRTNQG
ncbi:MAG: hypothetical protein Q8K75_01670 [Chlamydiales bacterium]|nr:hypothetical protein [Chlamydiales bacterium]